MSVTRSAEAVERILARRAEVLRLHDLGVSVGDIAAKLGVCRRVVTDDLAVMRTLAGRVGTRKGGDWQKKGT